MVYTFPEEVSNMRKDYIHKQFWKYVLPSMFTMLLSGFYSIVDGLFVGNAVGNDALAAINLVWPMQAILNASAIGIGIGGAVLISTFKGKNDAKNVLRASGLTVSLLVSIGLLLPITLSIFKTDILAFLGAEGVIFEGGMQYIGIILTGGLLPILGNGLNPIIRNYGKTMIATLLMSCGLISNVVLDYLFVFKFGMGLQGAALATIMAQGAVAVGSLIYLFANNREVFRIHNFLWDASMVKQVIRIGISPFGQTLVPSIVIVLTNWKCIQYGGSDAVTIFSVVSYILASVQLLLQGIGDGVQPLLSFYHGSQKEKEVHILYHKSFLLTLGVSLSLGILVSMLAQPLTMLFGIGEGIQNASSIAVMITALSFPFLGIVRLTSAYFYATAQSKHSTFIVYVEPLIILPVFLFGLSSIFSLNGVWFAYPAAQFVLCGISLLMKRPKKLHQQEDTLVCEQLQTENNV